MLTQAEADSLIEMDKSFEHPTTISIPPGTNQTHDLIGADKRERFLLDIWRGTLRLTKLKQQLRGRKVFVLVRLDIDGAPHTNPDGNRIGPTHLHLYRDGYEDRWAHPLDAKQFPDPTDMQRAFRDFCGLCHIVRHPPFQAQLQ